MHLNADFSQKLAQAICGDDAVNDPCVWPNCACVETKRKINAAASVIADAKIEMHASAISAGSNAALTSHNREGD